MGFWSTTEAAPSWLSTWVSHDPGFLRPEPPPLPHIPPPYSLVQLTTNDAAAITALWRAHYGGEDWTWGGDEGAILPYLSDGRVVGLGLRDASRGGMIVATIFAVPLGETTRMSHGAALSDYGFHVVEGLVVEGGLRGRGVAGWMIAAIDGTVSRLRAPRPFACLWAREVSRLPMFPTFVSCRPYAWKRCTRAALPAGWRLVSAAEFQPVWNAVVAAALSSGTPTLATTSMDVRRGGLLFLLGPKEHQDAVVISDTCRRSRRDGQRVYEIVYATATSGAAATATAAAAAVTGLLFTTLPVGREDGWTTGTSGYHAYSIYNYWPPAFGSCDLLFLREEL
jgi:hypothetical protein